jgi:hypothetical protein
MMNAQECRKRAEGCLRSAETNLPGAGQWHWLANTWATIAEQRILLEQDRAAFARSQRNATVEIAENLRQSLDLN